MIQLKGIAFLLLLSLAVADPYTIEANCSSCPNSTADCFFFNGGPFDNYQVPVADFFNLTSCTNVGYLHFPTTVNFDCDKSHSCQSKKCYLKLSDYSYGYCIDKGYANNVTNTLNQFYSYMKGNITLSLTYDWCSDACGSGLALWVIIVIIVAGVLLIAAIVVGIWWWRKKKGGQSQDYLNIDSAKNLLK